MRLLLPTIHDVIFQLKLITMEFLLPFSGREHSSDSEKRTRFGFGGNCRSQSETWGRRRVVHGQGILRWNFGVHERSWGASCCQRLPGIPLCSNQGEFKLKYSRMFFLIFLFNFWLCNWMMREKLLFFWTFKNLLLSSPFKTLFPRHFVANLSNR